MGSRCLASVIMRFTRRIAHAGGLYAYGPGHPGADLRPRLRASGHSQTCAGARRRGRTAPAGVGDTPVVATQRGRTSFDVTAEPLKVQFETFLDEHRAALRACLDGLTEQQARRSLVPSLTTLLGLVKHATFAERVWFGEAIAGRSRQQMGLPPRAADAFVLTDEDTIESVRAAYDSACAASHRATAGLDLDDVVTGHRFGPLPLRWIYLHALRELAQHCGHADILREQILSSGPGYPRLLHTVLDTTDVRGLAEFYRELLGLRYRPGDEPPAEPAADDADWLVLVDAAGVRKLAFQHVDSLTRTTWPAHDVPMQLHLDFTVPSVAELQRQRQRAEALGAELMFDRTGDPEEPLYTFADPSGHPFCIFVA